MLMAVGVNIKHLHYCMAMLYSVLSRILKWGGGGYILECTKYLCHNFMCFVIQVIILVPLIWWSIIIENLPERGVQWVWF